MAWKHKTLLTIFGVAVLIILAGATTSMVDYRTELRSVPILTDAGQPSLDAACRSAAGASLAITQKWTVQTMTCTANLVFTGGVIQPASGQKVTLSGSIMADLSQHFDTSLAGPGSILITGRVVAIYPNWFGAKMNGSADDTAAWQAAIASITGPGQRGGTIRIPGNVVSRTSTGIVIVTTSSQFVRIVGEGNSSVIQCTGVACVTWSGPAAQASGMEDLNISDPVGSPSTVGLYLNGGSMPSGQTNLRFSNVRISGNGGLQCGMPLVFCGLGTGVLLKNTVFDRFENVSVVYFRTDVLQTGFVNSLWFQSYMYGAGSRGWDIEASGDNYAIQMDFEGNTGTGIYLGTGAQNTSVSQSHFESNAGNHFEIAGTGAQLASGGNTYAGGTALVDPGGVLLSTGLDSMSALTITNNSTGGGSGLVGATLQNPLLGPALAGNGCTVSTSKGSLTASGTGCGTLPFAITGYSAYSVTGLFKSGGLVTSGTAATLGAGSACGSPMPTVTGTATAGFFTVGSATTTCTVSINLPTSTGPTGLWICFGSDQNANTPMAGYAGLHANSCSLKGAVTAGDVITFFAVAL